MDRATLLVALVPLGGCLVDETPPIPESFATCSDAEATEAEAERASISEAPTYWQDVAPILEARCAGCHNEDGIAPFTLTSYEDAFRQAYVMREAVSTGRMPPWQPDDCCQDYRWDRSLSAAQRETIIRWIDQGSIAGDPESPAPPLEVDDGGLPRVDLTLTMPEPFTPKPIIGADEVRCFVLDWPYDENVFVTGLNVVPGDRTMVHHVVVATVDADGLGELRAREGEDGRPGWDCWGELGAEGAEVTGSVGGWAPGYRGVAFPDGIGREVPASSGIILQMHYDTGRGIQSDQTSVELMIADSVDKEARSVGIVNPQWLLEGGMHIEADDPDSTVFFSYDPTDVLTRGKSFDIYAVNLHMHELGSVARLAILRADGTTECLLNIGDWDFDWLGEYFLEEPVRFDPGDRLYVECHWDNTAANQKFVNGEQVPVRDLQWGTDAEMCAGIVTAVEVER